VRLRRFSEGEQLYRQDEINSHFYFIKSGLVQVSIFRRDGTEVVLENMGPNALCGEGAAFDGLPRFSSAVAVEPTEALEFDVARLEALMREDPEFALALLRLTSLKQRILALRLEHLVSNDPEERILELLSRLSEMFAVDHKMGRKILTHLTHEQIASMTGTSRVTVTRTLGRLRDKGKLSVEEGYTILAGDLED
jgi:CRP/FNR family cyclic AMP-dependent transcriptional regulator